MLKTLPAAASRGMRQRLASLVLTDEHIDDIVERADRALYEAKSSARDRTVAL